MTFAYDRVFFFLNSEWGGGCLQFPFPPVVRYLNAYTGVVLLRCRKDFYQLVWSALPFITCLENKGHRYPCFFNTLHVGGMCGGCCQGVTGSEQLPGGWVFLLSSENKMFLPPPIPRKIVTFPQAVVHEGSLLCQVPLEPVRSS